MRNKQESSGDFIAQIAANRCGLKRLEALIEKMGIKDYLSSPELLNDYAATLAKNSLSDINDGQYCFEDVLDDGQGNNDIVIRVKVSFTAGQKWGLIR